MRVRVGVLTVGLVASVLAVGSPIAADDSSTTSSPSTSTTTTTDVTTTTDAPTTTEAPTTTDGAPSTTAQPTTTEVPTPSTSVVAVGTAPTPPPPLVISGGATPPATATEQATATTLAQEITEVGTATPSGGSNPVRGTQVTTKPLPPPPTTTTTTTIPPPWALPANSGTGRRVVYSKSAQRVWVVDSAGEMIKTHLVSGRQTPLDPRPGTYSVWSRSRYTHSIQNPSITWGFMVRFAKGGRGGNIGFHEIPFQYGRPVQSISQLGQPLSGGCVRQARPDAVWMWNWAYIGTKVVVLG